MNVVVGYIMFYDLLQNKINGSFFSKIDKAIELAKAFCELYVEDEEQGWADRDFEEILEKFVHEKHLKQRNGKQEI